MESGPRFLIFASSEDERLIYQRTLVREFPRALAIECRSPSEALLNAGAAPLDAAIVHFNASPESRQLLEALRRSQPGLPIVALSGVDRAARAAEAGATRFLLAGELTQLGPTVKELLASSGPTATSAPTPGLA